MGGGPDGGGNDPKASRIESISPCGLGEIVILALSTDIDGVVISQGTTTQGQGGPVTVNASCNFRESPSGLIESLGRDPGSDLVHVQGGCDVLILGQVLSESAGHIIRPSDCNGGTRPGHPLNSTACVEVWSGGTLTIDAVGSNRGEVGADTGFSGGNEGTSWVEIFARGDIRIIGDTNLAQNPPTTFAFAVHADQGVTNGHGGTIKVYSTDGSVVLQHLAIDASDLDGGSAGGSVDVQSKTFTNMANEVRSGPTGPPAVVLAGPVATSSSRSLDPAPAAASSPKSGRSWR